MSESDARYARIIDAQELMVNVATAAGHSASDIASASVLSAALILVQTHCTKEIFLGVCTRAWDEMKVAVARREAEESGSNPADPAFLREREPQGGVS